MASNIVRSKWHGKWAVVTGASAGIGEALSTELARAGVNLVLTARRHERLDELARTLSIAHGIETKVITADLEDAESTDIIFEQTEGAGLAIDLLVNNAGFGAYGEFYKSELQRQCAMVDVNCTAVVQLTGSFLPKMVERRRGSVLIVASTASFQPVPYMATYAATKVFDRFLAEALDEEVARYGVHVSALCPGPTESEFQQVAGSRAKDNRHTQKAADVARIGLEALAQGRRSVIPYTVGKLQTFMQRFLPRGTVTGAAEKMFRPENLKYK
jgi:short-subunit dehydrogenase